MRQLLTTFWDGKQRYQGKDMTRERERERERYHVDLRQKLASPPRSGSHVLPRDNN